VDDGVTIVGGIPIPSTSPTFLLMVAFHVALGLACTIVGIVAMLSKKRRGRHSSFGTIYYWCLSMVFVTASILTLVRLSEDYHLFILGALSFAAASWGRTALRERWSDWLRQHVIGMGSSYILLLTAFYVDNGKSLPIWRELPQILFWLLPGIIGIPIIAYVLLHHRLIRKFDPRAPRRT
jgi:hypothetical protein